MNKMDRPARDPLSLLDELEGVLGIGAFPVTWPLGSGQDFRGVYDRLDKNLHLFERTAHNKYRAPTRITHIEDDAILKQIPSQIREVWLGELEILAGAGESFDEEQLKAGLITPVFFGSGMNNFGVQLLLDYFVKHGAPPQPRSSVAGPVPVDSPDFSGFVFKVQANMNPRHRDRLTFVRVCSGQFVKDMIVDDPSTGKPVRLSHPQKLFGQDRESLDVAYPGDIVGLVTHKAFRIGDTLTTNPAIRYDEIPRFPPEAFAYIRNSSAAKYKQLREGLDQLLEEGIVQSFTMIDGSQTAALLGAVGQLQFDVVMYRLRDEYSAEPQMEIAPYTHIRWFGPGVNVEALAVEYLGANVKIAKDIRGQYVILFPSKWAMDYFASNHNKLELHTVSPHAVAVS
jgi:peptide chain release factor 3